MMRRVAVFTMIDLFIDEVVSYTEYGVPKVGLNKLK